MLGPSGSGKTTLLRIIAGFERPDSGTVELGGTDVTRQPPYAREREHGLPGLRAVPAHDASIENVEYGLKIRKVPEPERRRRAEAMLDLVRLSRARRPQASPAVRRAAPACGAGPGDRQRAGGAPARRAARGARPEAAPGDADRAEADPARGRDHLYLCDPRPGGGAHDERPAGRPERAAGSSRSARRSRCTSSPRPSSWPVSSAFPT